MQTGFGSNGFNKNCQMSNLLKCFQWQQILGHMAQTKTVNWVIYSGLSIATGFGSNCSYKNCQLSNL